MKNFLLLVAVFFLMSFSTPSWDFENKHLNYAIEILGEPTFSFETTCPMIIGVYGWEKKKSYFGSQTRNDTVIAFFECYL